MRPTLRRPFDRPSPARDELRALIAKSLRLPLGPYLKNLARASVASLALSACGMSHVAPPDHDGGVVPDADVPVIDAGPVDTGVDAPPPPPPPPPPPADLCDPTTGQYRAVHGLNPLETPTYLAALTYDMFRGPSWVVDEVGTACADATLPSCETELERLRTETWGRALLSTQGNEVRARLEETEYRELLGPIDTPNEAALLVWRAGYEIYCGGEFVTAVTELPDGYRVVAYQSSGGCGSPWVTTEYTFHVDTMGVMRLEGSRVVATEEDWGCIGRRPEGLAPSACSIDGSTMGGFFANVARLEESAVAAFDVMIAELEALGAPAVLLDAAREARADEVRHTDSMGAIARRYGVEPARPEIAPRRARTPFEIALENAVEGCVRETFGALVGAHQALRASDPVIADAMRGVADDEIRHAELSWAVAAWLEPQLTDEERARIADAKREAIAALRDEAAATRGSAELVDLAGLPPPATAVALVAQLERDLWA